MNRFLLLTQTIFLTFGATLVTHEPSRAGEPNKELTKATFLISGLQCPPCTRTVETSLTGAEGLSSIKVDWKTKNARVEFDEAVLPAQRVSQLIADTPHMMGGNMHYGSWLVFKVPELKDEATAKHVNDVLSKVEGVKQVATYPAQHSIRIAFATKGSLTTVQLIDVLHKAGIKATNL